MSKTSESDARMRPLLGHAVLVVVAFFVLVGHVEAGSDPHLDRRLLPEGCGSCHVGHGVSGSPMLPAAEENFCYLCHGDPSEARRMVSRGLLSPTAQPQNVKAAFEKRSHHPVERVAAHSPAERFMERNQLRARHSECLDCHNPHYTSRERAFEDVSGVTSSGLPTESVSREYEICYKCHSGSSTVSADAGDIRRKFDVANLSYHPVHSPGRNTVVPSLLPPYNTSSLIDCSDCHGNDDTRGPKGPHGSRYEPLLVANYVTEDEAYEDPFQYELCYRCHRRESILADESFRYHRLHLEGDASRGLPGTSCATCHDAHGSDRWIGLIDFNPEVVAPDPATGRLDYERGASGSRCFLSCHGVDHSPLPSGGQ